MGKHRVLDQILELDPKRDHERIVYLDACYEFPFDFTRADEFALYRTYAAPSIANLLYRTGEFTQRTQRRYDDTKLIISELVEHGYDSERGQRAMHQMNHHHGNLRSQIQIFFACSLPLCSNPPDGWRATPGVPWWSTKGWPCSTSGVQ